MFNLLDCALPLQIYDFDAEKKEKKGKLRARGVDDRVFSGMMVRNKKKLLNQDEENPDISEKSPENDVTEFVHGVTEREIPELGKIRIIATGLSKMPDFIGKVRKRIFYTINGQTHATENAGFFDRIKLGNLKEHVIIDVQCENLRNDVSHIFMGNREYMVEDSKSSKLRDIVKQELSNDRKLREYNNILKRRRTDLTIENDEETKKIFSDIVAKDPLLRELFGAGSVLPDISTQPGGKTEWNEGKQFPTKLDPLNLEKSGQHYIKELPLKSSRVVKGQTDAANDYLTRSNSPGRIYYSGDKLDLSSKTYNGTASFTFTAPQGVDIGDEFNLEIGFDDDGPRGVPLTFPLKIIITKEEEKQQNGGRERTKIKPKVGPAFNNPFHWVSEKYWREHNFNEKSGATILESENGVEIHINRDHERLAEMKQKTSDESERLLNERQYQIVLGFMALAIYHNHQKSENDSTSNSSDGDIDALVRQITTAIAPFILPVVKAFLNNE